MLQIDTPVLDLIYAEENLPAPEKLIEAMGGEEAAKTLMVLDVDLDAPQYETEINPTRLNSSSRGPGRQSGKRSAWSRPESPRFSSRATSQKCRSICMPPA